MGGVGRFGLIWIHVVHLGRVSVTSVLQRVRIIQVFLNTECVWDFHRDQVNCLK